MGQAGKRGSGEGEEDEVILQFVLTFENVQVLLGTGFGRSIVKMMEFRSEGTNIVGINSLSASRLHPTRKLRTVATTHLPSFFDIHWRRSLLGVFYEWRLGLCRPHGQLYS